MLNKEKFIMQCKKLKRIICIEYQNHDYEKCLKSITLLGRLRYMANIDYCDKDTDIIIEKIVNSITQFNQNKKGNDSYLVFYDSFGLDVRGLALIYLKALVELQYNIIYITKRKQKDNLPTIQKILNQNEKNKLFYIDEIPIINNYQKIYKFLGNYNVEKIILYLEPYDLIGIMLGISYQNKIERFFINLTDHAFWLGTNSFDYLIEFRDYGANVTFYYRKIDKKKIIKLPYYPLINKEFKFEGFPKETKDKKIIFSGGSLYKTFGDGNKYYYMIDYLLKGHPDIVFIYAGYGDETELDKLDYRYAGRVFHINERKDLFQMMKHSYLYLSTYPMIGGLMTQYAVSAGILPFTLIYDECGTGVLLDPKKVGIEFYDIDAMLAEIDHCIEDKEYMMHKRKKLDAQLISDIQFRENLNKILKTKKSDFNVKYNFIDTKNFRNTYLERITDKDINMMFGKKKFIHLFKYFPKEAIKGVLNTIKEKVCK